jgi:Holliday junction resolvasome RuvABC ATP-dependent DNA helicase subunit
LAGYPEEMDNLLESNPGLRSRFKKFFLFPDYSSEELLSIMDTYAQSFQYELTEAASNLLLRTMKEFVFNGNGRFATNLVDEMIQAQAMRLMTGEETDDLVEKSSFIEEEDVNKALKKLK